MLLKAATRDALQREFVLMVTCLVVLLKPRLLSSNNKDLNCSILLILVLLYCLFLGCWFFSVLFFERATNMLELDVLKVKEGEKVLNILEFVILSKKN